MFQRAARTKSIDNNSKSSEIHLFETPGNNNPLFELKKRLTPCYYILHEDLCMGGTWARAYEKRVYLFVCK